MQRRGSEYRTAQYWVQNNPAVIGGAEQSTGTIACMCVYIVLYTLFWVTQEVLFVAIYAGM